MEFPAASCSQTWGEEGGDLQAQKLCVWGCPSPWHLGSWGTACCHTHMQASHCA